MPKTKTTRVIPEYSVRPASPAKPKRKIQRERLEAILALEAEHEQVLELYRQWPQKLPRLVRAELSKTLREGYRDIKHFVDLKRDEAAMCNMVELEMAEMALEKCPDTVIGIVNLITSLPGQKRLTVVMSDPMNGLPDDEDDESNELINVSFLVPSPLTHKVEEDLLRLVGMACVMEGGVLIRQELTLRVQRQNASGVMEWVQQEKIYGCKLTCDGVHLLSAAEVKESYMHDHRTGELLPLDPKTSFGDLHEHHKKLMLMQGGNDKPAGQAVH